MRSLIGTVLLFATALADAAVGEGLEDFSAPPPETAPTLQQPSSSPTSPPSSESGLTAAEATLWRRIQANDSPHEYKDYLKRYPAGVFVSQAHQRLATLCEEAKQDLIAVANGVVGPAQWQKDLHNTELDLHRYWVDQAC